MRAKTRISAARRALSLFAAGAIVLVTAVAMACPPSQPPEYDRAQSSDYIFVGRVLDVEVVESGETDGTPVKLLELSVYVEESVKGEASSSELTTVYVVVEDKEARTDDAAAQDEEAVAMARQSGPWGNALPVAPEALSSYVFFSRSFDGESFVLVANSDWYLEAATESLVDSTRRYVSSPYGYY